MFTIEDLSIIKNDPGGREERGEKPWQMPFFADNCMKDRIP